MKLAVFQAFTDRQTLATDLACNVATWLRAGISVRGAASLVVSGGSTPRSFFESLKKQVIEWDKVYVTLADERWVDPVHPDSNEKQVREHLLTPEMHFISLKNKAKTPKEGAPSTSKAVLSMPLPFDVVVLGMGDDGHTASLFPHAPELHRALFPQDPSILCTSITPPVYAPHPRLTLTLPALLNAHSVVIHITGRKKQDVYQKACEEGALADMPVRAILRQTQTPVQIVWAA